MAGGIVTKLHVPAKLRLQSHVGEVIFGDEKWRRQVKESIGRKDLQVRILAHGIGEITHHVGFAHCLTSAAALASSGSAEAVTVIPALIHAWPAWKIGFFGCIFQLAV